jgi:hypothetical protein
MRPLLQLLFNADNNTITIGAVTVTITHKTIKLPERTNAFLKELGIKLR